MLSSEYIRYDSLVPSAPARPRRLGRFDILARIAQGGFCTVYLGRAGEQLAAVKVVRQDLERDKHAVEMFFDEARVAARLDHPNVLHTLEFGSENDRHFIATELLLGQTLVSVWDACVARNLHLRFDVAAWIAARVADGLAHAHDVVDDYGKPLGLIHRDVNPSNIFLTFDGGVKLFDFGLAKVEGRRATSSAGIVKGKLPYLAPEQIFEFPLDRRADIFALGTTLWEMTTMRRLFARRDDVDTVNAVRIGPIPDPRTVVPGYPDELAMVVRKALERNRDNRYPTAGALAADLDGFLARAAQTGVAQADPSQLIPLLLDTLFPGERARQTGWRRPSLVPPIPSSPPRSRR
jgi:eukaryotic-like serine/threonine-protein kinase